MRQMEDELRRFIIDNFLFGRNLNFSDDESFIEMGIIDSTGMLELVGFVEKRYGIEFHDTDLIRQNLDSVTQLTQFIRRRLLDGEPKVQPALQRQSLYSE